MKTTRKELNNLVLKASRLMDVPNNYELAKISGRENYLSLDNTVCYGGYRLVMISVKDGSESPVLGSRRVNADTMSLMLRAYIDGLSFSVFPKIA